MTFTHILVPIDPDVALKTTPAILARERVAPPGPA